MKGALHRGHIVIVVLPPFFDASLALFCWYRYMMFETEKWMNLQIVLAKINIQNPALGVSFYTIIGGLYSRNLQSSDR